MEYKEFGIYTNDENMYIIIENKYNGIQGFVFPNWWFPELRNISINVSIILNMNQVKIDHIFGIDLDKNPNTFYNFGYLGQVLDVDIKDELKQKFDEYTLTNKTTWYLKDLESGVYGLVEGYK